MLYTKISMNADNLKELQKAAYAALRAADIIKISLAVYMKNTMRPRPPLEMIWNMPKCRKVHPVRLRSKKQMNLIIIRNMNRNSLKRSMKRWGKIKFIDQSVHFNNGSKIEFKSL